MEEKKAKASSWSKIKTSKKLTLYVGIVFLVVLVIIFLAVILTNKSNEQKKERGDVVFSIEGEDYHKNEMLELGKYPSEVKGFGDDDVLTQVFDLKKEIAAIEKLEIKPSESEIKTAKDQIATEEVRKLNGYSDKYERWFNELARIQAGKKYVGGEFAPTHKGYVFVFGYFASEKQAVLQTANDFRQKLESGDLSPSDAAAQIKADTKFQSPNAETMMYGRDVFLNWDEEVKAQPVKDYINGLSSTGRSEVMDNEAGSYYFLIQADEVPSSSKIVSYEEFTSTLNGLSATHSGFKLSTEVAEQETNETGAQTNE